MLSFLALHNSHVTGAGNGAADIGPWQGAAQADENFAGRKSSIRISCMGEFEQTTRNFQRRFNC
jgi:hypothetical protein